jgi:hypothetical protein
MRLRVTRPGEAVYETMMAEFLTAAQVPKRGTTISVKVHPQLREVIVWAGDETD